jgi:hypothetical protein
MRFPASRIPVLAAALSLAVAAAPAQAQEPPPGPSGGTEATVDRPGLTVRPAALRDRTMRINGLTDAGDAGRSVAIDRQDLTGTWVPVATTTVDGEGRFTALWRTDTIGRVVLRATVARDTNASAAGAPLTAQVTIFQPAIASWYGPRFFGRQTACGTKLTRKTVGVAHKTLPCGTLVDLYHGGRTLTVPVIDRGPFVAGRDWDLTQAAARQLGVKATVRIGFLPPAGVPLRRAVRPRR